MVIMPSLLKTVFSGSYTFDRCINSGQWLCQGKRIMQAISDTEIICKEEGTCCVNHKKQRFSQKQFLVITPDNFYIEKSDRTLLHQFTLNQDKGENTFPWEFHHTHFCKKDIYTVRITLKNFDQFSTFYRINGPAKNSEIITHYCRAYKKSVVK